LQVYASRGEDKPSAFHRVLHVFVCTNCQPNCVRVFRAQLPLENPFYSSDKPDSDEIAAQLKAADDKDVELDPLQCAMCGLTRDSTEETCCECKRRARNGDSPYVLQERELSTAGACIPDEEEGVEAEAEEQAEGDSDDKVATVGAVPVQDQLSSHDAALHIVKEADDVIASAQAKGASDAMVQKLKEYRTRIAQEPDSAIDGSEQKVFDEWCRERGEKDSVFSKFQRYALANRGHVLRYEFGAKPLWFCKSNRLVAEPPQCKLCGAPRVFEFQVQPQLIALLGESIGADRLDYGIICCYVCSQSCDAPEGTYYMEEFAHVQPEPKEAWLPKG